MPERMAREATSGRQPSPLFALLWDELVEVLGAPASAALLRRSLKRAAESGADLQGIAVLRDRLAYVLRTPEWSDGAAEVLALQAVTRELSPLLIELTGSVVIRRLGQIPQFRSGGIRFPEGEP